MGLPCPSKTFVETLPEEAMQELDAFIDQALLNNMSQVEIIHGIGTGVIRDAVNKNILLILIAMLKNFEYAPQSAGGSGCTIITLVKLLRD